MVAGKLYLIPLAIGNPEDISLRALRLLREVDLVLAEDTRTARLALSHYDIKQTYLSYHKFNERSRFDQVAELLMGGKNLALVSDAGCPCISDPGQLLVATLRDLYPTIEIIPLPGANAGLTGLIATGFANEHFYFEGFLPQQQKKLQTRLDFLCQIPDPIIIYEAPHRLVKTLSAMAETPLNQRKVCLARELTKKYEEFQFASLDDHLVRLADRPARGEFVVIIDCLPADQTLSSGQSKDRSEDLDQAIQAGLAKGLTIKDLSDQLSKAYPLSKNQAYKRILKYRDKDRT